MPGVDFYYDFVSPYSYLACCCMPVFNREHHIEANCAPFLLPQLMRCGLETLSRIMTDGWKK